MKWILIMLCSVARAEFNPVPTGDVKVDTNLKNVVEEMRRVETAVTTTTWINAGIVISTTAGAPSQGVKFQDGTIQYTAAGAPTLSPQPSWQGINYWVGGSSGTRIAYSTGATEGVTTAVDSFHIVDSSWVVNGTLCHTNDTLYTVVRSTIQVVWLNTSCALQISGSTTTSWASISSYTAVIAAGIPIVISSTGASGDVHLYTIVNELPVQSLATVWAGRGAATNALVTTAAAAPDPWWPCLASKNVFPSCTTGTVSLVPTQGGRGYMNSQYSGGALATGVAFVVNNTGSGSQNITFSNAAAGAAQASVDGKGLQAIAAGTNSISIAIGTGYHQVIVQSAGEGGVMWTFPPNMTFVRPGPI